VGTFWNDSPCHSSVKVLNQVGLRGAISWWLGGWLQVVDIAAAVVAAIEAKAGLQCRWVTGGGSGTYKLEAGSGVFNEVQPGEALYQCPAQVVADTAVLLQQQQQPPPAASSQPPAAATLLSVYFAAVIL